MCFEPMLAACVGMFFLCGLICLNIYTSLSVCLSLRASLCMPARLCRDTLWGFVKLEQAFASRLSRRRYSTSVTKRKIGHQKGHSLASWEEGVEKLCTPMCTGHLRFALVGMWGVFACQPAPWRCGGLDIYR